LNKSPEDQAAKKPPKETLNQLIALHGRVAPEEFLVRAHELAAEYPHSAMLQNILGVANADLKRVDAAIGCYQRALAIAPAFAAAHNNLGNMLREKELFAEAMESYRRALDLKPGFAEAHNNLGNVHKDEGNLHQAIESYRRAAELKPAYAEAHYNLGITLEEQGSSERAALCLKRAIALSPDYAEAHFRLGSLFADTDHREAALACYRKALEIKPDFASALAKKLHQQAHMCDWKLWEEFEAVATTLGIEGEVVVPFAFLALDDHPGRQRLRAENFAREHFKSPPLAAPAKPATRPAKLRIGYFSADFRAHAVMYLMARLFEVHDGDRFTIFAYSYGEEETDSMRERVERNVDCFRDVKNRPSREIAALARADGIDIAVDLQGYTGNTRSDILSFRPAPVQINYLGYPGTMGADFYDYVVADDVVIPEQERSSYSEQIIYLPHSYLVSDDTRAISERHPSRSEFRLPEEAFVFCCFNGHYKISPREFDIWMRLLKRIDGSVLWLRSSKWAEDNLRREAEVRGVDGERIIFAGHLDGMDEHLARHRMADLFLDTFNYNAHTTASDALWAGLSVVTKAGRGFAARVSASLLTALELPELITETEEDYEALAMDLASRKDRLEAIRLKLAENRRTQPLYDTELFARHLESAFEQAYELYFRGERPRTIRVNG
jgi:predicted O-linked N-acetylglucosamine transferase (SPINDLY family)